MRCHVGRLVSVLVAGGFWLGLAACGGSSEDPPGDVEDPTSPLAGVVFINELPAGQGEGASDWVEIVNTGADAVSLAGVRLTAAALDENVFDTSELTLPGELSLASGAVLVVDEALTGSSGDEASAALCPVVFRLPGGTIEIVLRDSEGLVVDRVEIAGETRDGARPGTALGRFPDGDGELAAQSRPSPGGSNPGPAADDPCLASAGAGAFDDHTAPCLGSSDSFFWLAGSRAGTTTVKFDIMSFRDPVARHVTFLDSVFYSLHDEWYFFRMLNGQPFEGEEMYTPVPGDFASIEEIYAWATTQDTLPHDETFLDWSGDRLLSRRFYDLAIDIQPRILGAGTLIHVPARSEPKRDAMWGFELEFRDAISHEDLMVYFDELAEVLPEDILKDLRWFVRSPEQETLAQAMEAGSLRHHERIVRYSELSVPGEVQVYNGGLVAGRVRVIRAGEPGLGNATTSDILVLEEIPDYLPPCRALITTVPQTPLSHISLLAESRGIPNLYIGGLTDDPSWDQWGRVRARVALYAKAPGEFEAVAMTTEQYDTWRDLVPDNDRVVPGVDIDNVPRTVDLASQDAYDMPSLRPLLGGKSAGFLTLLGTDGLSAPDHPLSITVRAYHEHLQPLRAAWLDALLALPEFRFLKYRQTRYLVLEGETRYDQRYATPSGQKFKSGFFTEHPPGDWLGDLVRAGGVRAVIESTPIESSILAEIEAVVAAHFDDFKASQGLRFRSSSNVEDIEGFNGAGLYESNTGFIDAASQRDPGDREKTIESALLATWSSYWSWEAYDERLSANIDHLSGNMGVLVHARFDDNRERANGVLTVTRYPDVAPVHAPGLFADQYEMRVNVQSGSVSVANPPPGQCILPEAAILRAAPGELTPRVERVQESTEVFAGQQILSDEVLRDLFARAVSATELWRDIERGETPAAQEQRTVTLDFEFRIMGAGWPDLASGPAFGDRVIIKQVRSLEPSPSDIPDEVRDMPFPRDVLARARTVTRRVCTGDSLTLTALEVSTDPLRVPDLGHDTAPFTAQIAIDVTGDVPELGWSVGDRVTVEHIDLASFDHPGMTRGEAWNLAATVAEAGREDAGFATLEWTPDLSWEIVDGSDVASGVASACTVETLHATPDNYLLSLLAGE